MEVQVRGETGLLVSLISNMTDTINANGARIASTVTYDVRILQSPSSGERYIEFSNVPPQEIQFQTL